MMRVYWPRARCWLRRRRSGIEFPRGFGWWPFLVLGLMLARNCVVFGGSLGAWLSFGRGILK